MRTYKRTDDEGRLYEEPVRLLVMTSRDAYLFVIREGRQAHGEAFAAACKAAGAEWTAGDEGARSAIACCWRVAAEKAPQLSATLRADGFDLADELMPWGHS